jgi:hypothetical protein
MLKKLVVPGFLFAAVEAIAQSSSISKKSAAMKLRCRRLLWNYKFAPYPSNFQGASCGLNY